MCSTLPLMQDDDSYLGYSVATGEFNGDGDGMDVAVGMPRGANLTGKVIIILLNILLLSQKWLNQEIRNSAAIVPTSYSIQRERYTQCLFKVASARPKKANIF